MKKRIIQTVLMLLLFVIVAAAQRGKEWQWSAPVKNMISPETNDHPVAFLYIPPTCNFVKGVVVGQHNMIEEGIFEHPTFRKMLADLQFAVVWVSPNFSITFDFNNHAGEDFNNMMQTLADASGYVELASAPVVPVGHSALASYPWNFAAWNPDRTLAIVSIHGDAPLTHLTGSGRPNPDWQNRTIDGVPGLMIMGEYEWWEERIAPGFQYVSAYPKAAISFFADAGHGHFDYSDDMISYMCLFIRKAAKYRLPAHGQTKNRAMLKPINPENGWLMDRWHKDSLPNAKPAPHKQYKGDRYYSSWIFDQEMAQLTEAFYAKARGKKNQFIGFIQKDSIVQPKSGHAQFNIPFIPLDDGISFQLKAFFADSTRTNRVAQNANSPLSISRICGPVKKMDDSTFQISFNRVGFNNTKRSNDIWLLAFNQGDAQFKSAVQQGNMRFPLWNKDGSPQQIIFDSIPDQKAGIKTLTLHAYSTATLPVQFYMKEGPAYIVGNKIHFTQLPPRSKIPFKVTVVAWQYGNANSPKCQSAEPVERSFFLGTAKIP